MKSIFFGPFTLRFTERSLERDGAPIRLGSRELDTLILLVERAGEVVPHQEFLKRVWPNATVSKGSVRVTVAGLRKALGDDGDEARYITNVPGRGYCFIVSLETSPPKALEMPDPSRLATRAATLPACLKRMIGRESVIPALTSRLISSRFVSIVAAGGMGKTSVAVMAAHALLQEFDGKVFFIDCGSLADSRLIADTIGSTLGITVQPEDPVSSLVATLSDRKLLLVIDNCEHLIGTIAPIAERLFLETDRVHILATSRESLRVEGEHVYRLPPLETPAETVNPTAEYVMGFSAVQLFVERSAAGGAFEELTDADAPIVARLCDELDGLPLAIELAAGKVNALGLHRTATLLESRLRLTWEGRRTAVPRHKTLGAMLDWSYKLLSDSEQLILRRLSIFVGRFNFAAARNVVFAETCCDESLAEGLAGLVEKSLLSRFVEIGGLGYRLLDSTRVYAAVKLSEAGEADLVAARHARHLMEFLGRLKREDVAADEDRSFRITPQLGNARKALEWCFSEKGDPILGCLLVAATAELFVEASLISECRDWAEKALSNLRDEDRGTAVEMAIQEALASSSMFTRGNRDDVRQAFERGLSIAESLQDNRAKMRMLYALVCLSMRHGEVRKSFEVSQKLATLRRTSGIGLEQGTGNSMGGIADHLIGSQRDAVRICEESLARASGTRLPGISSFSWVSAILVVASLARASWIQGFPERAVQIASRALAEGREGGRPIKRCMSLIYTTHVFLWSGDYEKAESLVEEQINHARQHGLIPYHAVGLGMRGELLVKRGEAAVGIALLEQALEIMTRERHLMQLGSLKTSLAEGLAATGQHQLALQVIDEVIGRVLQFGNSFDLLEMMRVKGAILAAMGNCTAQEAESCLFDALARANAQGDLGWELRIANTLAELLAGQGRSNQACSILSEIHARFTEGHGTLDLRRAVSFIRHSSSSSDLAAACS